LGDVPYRRLRLESEVAEASTETIECVLFGIRRLAKSIEAVNIRLRRYTKSIKAVGIRRRHRPETGEATEGRHRHHSEAACKRSRHRAEVGVLRVESIEAGVDDIDSYFRFRFDRDGLCFCLASFPALGAPFGGRELWGCFICFCRQDCCPGDAGLSSEDLHKAKKANGHHG